MIDPWRHLDDWNKPANRDDDTFQRFFEETIRNTRAHEERRVILRGRTTEVIDRIPDCSLDFAYVDGDHSLRGITIDLLRVYPRIRDGGWIGGDDFSPSIWQHEQQYEPTLVFPFAVYFAEAVGSRIYGLPHGQFLIEKRHYDAFEFVDLTGTYGHRDLLSQMSHRSPRG
jgi:methyltransferase family protein